MIDKSINKNIDRIALRLKTIPESPGVYQHIDEKGQIIYVGKARNLQKRVQQYFTDYNEKSAKIKMLVRKICDIRVTVVANEVDALLLENTLIKQYKPRYNSLLKDDKTYPYLCITDEDYPRVIFTRNRRIEKGQFFGPYPNQRIMRELQDIIAKLFSVRTCSKRLKWNSKNGKVEGGDLRPCMKQQIGLCKGPCCGLQSRESYLSDIENIRRILKGEYGDIIDQMKREMMLLAEDLRFEEAEAFKRKIMLLEEYRSRSAVVGTNVKDVDVYTVVSDVKYAYVNMMRVKDGNIIYSFSTEIKKQLDESDDEILATVIPALHEETRSSASEMVVERPIEEIPEEYMRQNVAPKGDRLRLLQLSLRNASAHQHQCNQRRLLAGGEEPHTKLLRRLQELLSLPSLPMNIECFDNSNIQGAFAVAAMVRFTGGKPHRKEYRHFNIKTVEGPDDYASMAEVVYRRYKRLSDEGKALPDLLMVDGGRGQMEVAREVVEDLLHLNIPIAGLAKDDRHRTSVLLYGFPPKEVMLEPTDPLFKLFTRIQDEVHRFAISFHKNKRSKGTIKTQLTDIEGIGEKTAQELLLKFGSVKQIRLQTLEDLVEAIGTSKAKLVYDYFQGK